MYSQNDYRYYLEHRLAQSDDFLAHYGIKGMKWKKHKSTSYDPNTGMLTRTRELTNGSKSIGIQNFKYTPTGETGVRLYTSDSSKSAKRPKTGIKIGEKLETYSTGNSQNVAIETTSKKKKKKIKARKVANRINGISRGLGLYSTLAAYNGAVKEITSKYHRT